MPRITSFDRLNLATLRVDIDAAVKVLNEKYAEQGVLFSLGRGSFSPETCTFKLDLAVKGDSDAESPQDVKAARDWKECEFLGLKPEWLGAKFMYGRREVQVIGYIAARSKFPILAKETDGGKRVLLPLEPVKAILERQDDVRAVVLKTTVAA